MQPVQQRIMMIQLFFLLYLSFNILATEATDTFFLGINDCNNTQPLALSSIEKNEISPAATTIHQLQLSTATGISVPVTFYDRQSDVVVIAVQGLPAQKESMEIFTEIFPLYDIICFDFRWNGNYEQFLMRSIIAREPIKRVLLDEIEELETVVSYVLHQKKYSTVVGLGECYGCFHVAKLQSDAIKQNGKGPFTHIILDSCWHSLRSFAERICYDPYLPLSPQEGGAPKAITLLTDNFVVKKVLLGSLFKLLPNISMEPYITTIQVPVLFIHGRNDLFVPFDHFTKIFNAANSNKRAVLFTPYQHSNNIGNKKVYQTVVHHFLQQQSMFDLEQILTQ